MPENADMIGFLDIFLDEEFYNMITAQIYMHPYFAKNIPFSPDTQELESGKSYQWWNETIYCFASFKWHC